MLSDLYSFHVYQIGWSVCCVSKSTTFPSYLLSLTQAPYLGYVPRLPDWDETFWWLSLTVWGRKWHMIVCNIRYTSTHYDQNIDYRKSTICCVSKLPDLFINLTKTILWVLLMSSPVVWITRLISPLPLLYNSSKLTKYGLPIKSTFIFDWCRANPATVTTTLYDSDSRKLTCIFAE